MTFSFYYLATNSNTNIIGGENNNVTGYDTVLIGAKDVITKEHDKIYLGNSLKIDTITGVSYLNNVQLNNEYSLVRLVTNEELLNLYTTPIRLVGNVGENKYIKVTGASAFLKYNSTPFIGDTSLKLHDTNSEMAVVKLDNMLSKEVSGLFLFDYTPNTPVYTKAVMNGDLYLTCDNTNPVGGDSDVIIELSYKIIDITNL